MGFKGAQNRFKYECQECGAMQMIPRRAFDRRSRPRCSGCGSIALSLVSKEAKRRVMDMTGEAKTQKDRLKDTAE